MLNNSLNNIFSKKQSGITLLVVVIILGIIIILGLSLLTVQINTSVVVQRTYNNEKTFSIAEAGIDKAVWCLNNDPECGEDYSGETTTIGEGQFTTTLASIGSDYSITSVGTVNNVEKTIKATISTRVVSAGASFFYGVQVGAGGLVMGQGSSIDGNIYSNGSISAGNNAYVTGDVYVAGGTALTPDQEQTTQDTEYTFGDVAAREAVAQSFKAGITENLNYISLYLKKTSTPNNATVYITEDNSSKPDTTELASGTLYSGLITTTFAWVDIALDSTPLLTSGETYWIIIDSLVPKATRYYTTGENIDTSYTDGTAKYSSDWSGGIWNSTSTDFTFKIWMGGIDTEIDNLEVGIVGPSGHTCDDVHYATHHGDAHANKIINSDIECDAYYNSDPDDILATSVGRNKVQDSDDPPPEPLPISDARIQEWKKQAEDETPFEGDKTIDGTSTSLGPLKITGNLNVINNATLTISGTLWVEGDITFNNGATIRLDPGYGSSSGTIVTDGQITVNNNCIFEGSGDEDSYILVLSTNNSLDSGSPAIEINNNAQTVIFYAGDGLIKVGQNARLREATAYKLELANNSSVDYVSGLASANFSSGPGGIWTTQNSTWQIID